MATISTLFREVLYYIHAGEEAGINNRKMLLPLTQTGVGGGTEGGAGPFAVELFLAGCHPVDSWESSLLQGGEVLDNEEQIKGGIQVHEYLFRSMDIDR
ncbi:hypothetical protein CEXT_323011 [Caerostris extrusa]|uniref:Uncharacterized protein n=1 Tax=Caerostris extrusa TaxID=172846 RepID=A0AAV4N189_CAEEX|nr:hypothetical protein CEXT_323011 [Caerostris extrusa]